MISMLSKFIVQENVLGEYKIEHINVFVRQKPIGNINLNLILKTIKQLPLGILNTVNKIEIGDFEQLRNREVSAIYDNKTIFISSNLESEKEILENIIHEFAHACEHEYYGDMYLDGEIRDEFINKRLKMFHILQSYGFTDLPEEAFYNLEYDQEFDTYLYKNIGYNKLGALLRGLFLSPYAATSLREYFANGFEKYFLQNPDEVKRISPALYKKMTLFTTT